MLARLTLFWVRVRDSLWFLPCVFTVIAVVLAFVTIEVERRERFAVELADHWVLSSGAEGARGVLTAIAGGLITVTGVVFSVTIVALQLASSQFTPRVLRNFTADRGNQVVLGVFIATFTFTLLVLRAIRSETEEGGAFVPELAVTMAVVLVLVSIGFLIFFINHAARSVQVEDILARVSESALSDVQRLFPETLGHADAVQLPDPRRPGEEGAVVTAAASGYLQAVDGATLFDLGERQEIVLAMEPYIGDYIMAGQPLVRVWPPDRTSDETEKAVRLAFVLGRERTPEQDVEFGVIEIADIAVKALSPGINDPTTVMRCIDHLGEVLLTLGTRRPPRDRRTREGNVHFIGRHSHFARAVGLGFDQIRHFGASNPMVARKLLSTLTGLARLLPPRNREVALDEARAVLRAARAQVADPMELRGLERLAEILGLSAAAEGPEASGGSAREA